MIHLAELVNAFAREEHPSSGQWHVHRRAPLLLNRLAGDLDGLHEAHLRVECHANWLPTKSEVYRAEGSGVKQRHCFSIPVAFLFLVWGFDVCLPSVGCQRLVVKRYSNAFVKAELSKLTDCILPEHHGEFWQISPVHSSAAPCGSDGLVVLVRNIGKL